MVVQRSIYPIDVRIAAKMAISWAGILRLHGGAPPCCIQRVYRDLCTDDYT